MNGSVTINSAMGMIYFTNRGFDFFFVLMITSFSIFKVIIISIGTYDKLLKKPSQSKLIIVFLNESISL